MSTDSCREDFRSNETAAQKPRNTPAKYSIYNSHNRNMVNVSTPFFGLSSLTARTEENAYVYSVFCIFF